MKKEQITPHLQAILKSPEFCNSKIYCDLLAFLVDYAVKGEMPKEINIAIEFFKKDTTFDPSSDSTVRSHVHHLRKKLDSYYRNDGKNDTLQLVIPKGHYIVNFVDLKPDSYKKFKRSEIFLAAIVCILLVLISGQIFLKPKSNYQIIPKDQHIWHEFFNDEKPVLFILGDHYFYMAPSPTNPSTAIRDFEINSDSDLDKFIASQPNNSFDEIKKTSHTYMTKRIPWAMHNLLPSFVVHNKQVDVKLASEVQWDDFLKYNIVFIGAFRSLGLSEKIINDLPFSYDNKKGILTLTSIDSSTTDFNAGNCSDFQSEMQDAKDYAMVIKTQGPNHNSCLFFLSTHDIGIISTIRYFTNPNRLEEFTIQNLSPKSGQHFFSLFQVQGVARTDFQIKLLHHHFFNLTND